MALKESDKKSIVFDAILTASTEHITRIVKEWTVGQHYYHGLILKADVSGKFDDHINVEFYQDRDGEKAYRYAGQVRLNEDLIYRYGTRVQISFWDWETYDPNKFWSDWNCFATLPNAKEVFDNLVFSLRYIPTKEKIFPIASITAVTVGAAAKPEKPTRKKLLDQACIEWTSRKSHGYLGRYTRNEFLEDFQEKTGELITKDEFRRALEDAQERGIIENINGRLITIGP